ncbi:MAG: zinc ribbon domain-containing protein [Anaerolineae bacterium]
MSRTHYLYQLQTVDSEIEATQRRLKEIEAMIGETEEVKAARAENVQAAERVRVAQTSMQDLDLEVKSLEQKIAELEKRLYSGSVLNAKEAASLQDEVTSIKRWHTQREEKLLGAMLAVEEAETGLAASQEKLAALEASWNSNQAELAAQRTDLQERLAALQEERPLAVARVAEDDLAVYNNLRQKKAGRAVTNIRNGVCVGCGVAPSSSKVQQARSGRELVFCGSCGRILHV